MFMLYTYLFKEFNFCLRHTLCAYYSIECSKVKGTAPENAKYYMDEIIPYTNAKPLYLVEDVDDKDKLAEIGQATVEGLQK